MNTNPDETKLALWLEDELPGGEIAHFEACLRDQPDHAECFARRDDARAWRRKISAVLPASEEPAYPDFFNSRIAQMIREGQPKSCEIAKPQFSWKSVFLPLAACAGMVLAFWLGTQSRPAPMEIDVTGAPRAIPVEPILYTPETGVVADCFASPGASATVIILNGVTAIPDETDFSATAFFKLMDERESTADIETETHEPTGR